MTFPEILDKYRKSSFSERDKGNRFERLMQAYLQTDPQYAYQFKNVWLWNEFPGKDDLGGTDTGIDLVALTHNGEYWAVQCKCYQESATIDKTKESGIKNDPNDWASESGNPRYILDLLLSIINVSIQTVDIVAALPGVRFDVMEKEGVKE
jgi:predicted helicase